MSASAQSRVLVQLALRSITSHKVKSLIVGGILAFGTFLLALNTTFLNNIEDAMERSVTRSLIGHMQVISDQAKDDLAFFGPAAQQSQDLGVLPDFKKVRETLLTVPNVQAVVPMGRDIASALSGNIIDAKLAEMREAVNAGDMAKAKAMGTRIRQLATLIRAEYEKKKEISSNIADIEAALAVVDRVDSDAFWAEFEANPKPALEYLDTKLAPLQEDGTALFLAYIGTDLDMFAEKFDTFEIEKGTMVPKGMRGMLLSKEFHEKQAKNRLARILDEMNSDRTKEHKKLGDPSETVLNENAKKLERQYKRIVYELGPDESVAVEKDLRGFFQKPDAKLDDLVKELLTVNEQDFDGKYKAFYDFVAPRIRLYSVNIGDTITLRAYTRSGYSRAANLKVYGTFQFRGLDGSLLASVYNLMDIMSFRDLYGLMTPERKKELEAIKSQVGVKDVSADDAEAALFGGSAELEATGTEQKIEEDEAKTPKAQLAEAKPFTQDDIDGGVVLNAAVILKDGTKLRMTMPAVEKAAKDAGIGLKTQDWMKCAGIIGQFILVMRVVLIVAFIIIFITALAIINNSMLMSMMDRITEIGTMRAIGAQRRFVLGMFLLESAALSVTSVVLGLLAANGLVHLLNAKGLPAAGTNSILIVLFGGPHLNPHMTTASVVVATLCIAIVSFIATLYPAIIATRVAPVVAMQRRE